MSLSAISHSTPLLWFRVSLAALSRVTTPKLYEPQPSGIAPDMLTCRHRFWFWSQPHLVLCTPCYTPFHTRFRPKPPPSGQSSHNAKRRIGTADTGSLHHRSLDPRVPSNLRLSSAGPPPTLAQKDTKTCGFISLLFTLCHFSKSLSRPDVPRFSQPKRSYRTYMGARFP